MIEGVIFDLDGTLIDSEPLQYRSFNDVFRRHGHPVSPQEYDEWRGWQVIPRWIESRGLSLDPDPVRAQKKQIYDQLIRTEVTLKPGARALVESAAQRLRLGIASGSRRESIVSCLEKFDLLQHFEALCSSTDVGRGKPHPAVLHETARRLSLSPESAVVIEDSIMGLRAAEAAGMACIVCPDQFLPAPREALGNAAMVVESLEHLTLEQILAIAR